MLQNLQEKKDRRGNAPSVFQKTISEGLLLGHAEGRGGLTPKTLQKRPRAPKPIFWALEYENSGNEAPKFEEYQKNGTCAP